MSAKIVFVLCANALFVQVAFSQVLTAKSVPLANSGFGTTGFGSILNSGNSASLGNTAFGSVLGNSVSSSAATVTGLTGLNVVAGGPLTVTSISPIGPSGLAVASENVLEGVLTVNGQLPFLSAVAFEGSLPTSGSGVATCGCGNGQIGITGEGLAGASLNGLNRF